ncbi:MAG: hypothetical protein JWO46_840 [Nocardioidaceae bacterium]|nr:hypothetical protein [Nocardioidaceae bacterium]
MSASSGPAVERLSPQQIEARLAGAPVAYLPLGTLEFHGPHLPVGLDALTAHGICLAAAELSGGIVLPAFYHGVGGEHTDYPWTIMSGAPDAIEALLGETLARLCELGVQRAVILSGHFADEQRGLVMRVADDWNARESTMSVVARTLGQVPEPPVVPDHAGRFESLVLHALHPDLVHVELLPDVETHPAPAGEDPYGAARHDPDHPLHGIFGADPRRLGSAGAAPLLDHLVRWTASLAGHQE